MTTQTIEKYYAKVDKLETVDDLLDMMNKESLPYTLDNNRTNEGEWLQIPKTTEGCKIAMFAYQLKDILERYNLSKFTITETQDTFIRNRINYIRIKILI